MRLCLLVLVTMMTVAAQSGQPASQSLARLVASITGSYGPTTFADPASDKTSTPEQLRAAEWLRGELGEANAATPYLRTSQFHLTGEGVEDTIGVFYFARASSEQELNVISEMTRVISLARRMQTYAPRQAIVLRGTQANITEAEWLLTQLHRALPLAQGQSTPAYPAANGELLTVFYLRADIPESTFREQTTSIRTAGAIGSAYAYWPTRVFAVRANKAQLTRIAAQLGQ